MDIINLETCLSPGECPWWAVPFCWQCLVDMLSQGVCGSPGRMAAVLWWWPQLWQGTGGQCVVSGAAQPQGVVYRQTPCVLSGDTAPPLMWDTCRCKKAGRRDLRGREDISWSKLVLWAPPLPGDKAQVDLSPLSGAHMGPSCSAVPIEAASPPCPGVNGENVCCRKSRGFSNTWINFRA